jgi:regulatory protein
VPEHSSPEQGGARVVRLDGLGIDEAGPAPVARLDLPAPAEPARPAADLTDLRGPDATAPVASFTPHDGSADNRSDEGVAAEGARERGAAPVVLFDAAQLASTGSEVPVAELGTAARGRAAGRRARSTSGDGGREGERWRRSGDGADRADRADPTDRGSGVRADRANRAARAERAAPAEWADRGSRAAQVDGAGPVDGDGHERADYVEPAEQTGRRRRSGRGDRAERRGRSASDAGARGAGTAGQSERRSGGEPDADPVSLAREICLRLLTDRARTRQELAQALRRKGIPDDAAGTVLERFDEVGLIDDAAFAGQWVRSRHAHRGLARRAIAMELRRKGVADEVAGEALAEVDGESEERRARELVDRKLRSMKVASAEQQAVAGRRLVGMLARKGYGAGVAYRVVREALAEHGADVEELDGAEPPND